MNYHDILRFDGLFGVLSWDERMNLHRFHLNKEELNRTPQLERVIQHIEVFGFDPPNIKIKNDDLQWYCHLDGKVQLKEDWVKEHRTNEIKELQRQKTIEK